MAFRKYVILSALLTVTAMLVGCSSDETTTSPIVTSEAPILPPTSVSVREISNGSIEITWTANTQAHFKGYNVYRVKPGEAIGRINSSLVSNNRYVDGTANSGSLYDFWVTSVSAKGAESAFSVLASYSPEVEGSKDRGLGNH